MNCDQAFEHLTDPDLADSVELRQHLVGCPRCRDMQETLAPALALFARDHAAPGSMPEPRPAGPSALDVASVPCDELNPPAPKFLTTEAVEIAEIAARRLSTRTPAHDQRWRIALRYAAVFLIGCGVVFTVAGGRLGGGAPAAAPAPQIADCTRVEAARNDLALRLPSRQVVQSCVACHLATH
ncbi:MAG TPA: hypothetical protein VHB77_00885 [Planctomycetaceae bacterium]|nr:hypothetical protein [Planctomycetaceae bacterium]